MNKNWKEQKLGDFLILHYGKALPAEKRKNGNIPVYSSAGLTGYHNEALVQSEGLILGRKGTIGKIYKSKKPFFVIDTAYYITPNNNYDLDFVYYLLQTLRLEELNEDSAVPGLNREAAYSQSIFLPNILEQKRIASILLSLDDGISLLREINLTLEKIAQAIFKSWFVDFEPTKAKIAAIEAGGTIEDATLAAMTAISGKSADELEKTHLENPKEYESLRNTADLFPSELEKSELGLIPIGWNAKKVVESADFVNGAAYANKHFSNEYGSLPIVKIAELKYGITENTKFTNVVINEKYQLKAGDVLFSWSGSPDTSIDIFIWNHGPAWLNQHIFKVINKTNEERCFTFFLLKYLKPFFVAVAKNKQTTGLGHVTKKNLEEMYYCSPDNAVLHLFYNIAGSIMGQIEGNILKNEILTKTRNIILPKLLSGEINVIR